MSGLGPVLRKSFIMKGASLIRIKREVELVIPAKFEPGLRQSVIAFLSRRMSLG
jgi:hypothetical protein